MQRDSTKIRSPIVRFGCIAISIVVLSSVALCLSVVILLPSPWNHYRTDPPAPFQVLDDPFLDFVIGYPASWQAIATPRGIQVGTPNGPAMDTSVKALMSPVFLPGPTILVHEKDTSTDVSAEAMALERQQTFQREIRFRVLSLESSEIEDTRTFIAKYSWDDKTLLSFTVPTRSFEAYFVRKSKGYTVRLFGIDADYLETLFDRIVRSIHFRK